MTVLTAPPTGAPPEAPEGTALYECDCPGFRNKNPRQFCLRCLTIWVEGLPGVFSGQRLEREMRRAAIILARRLRDDPEMARVTIKQALQAADSPRRN